MIKTMKPQFREFLSDVRNFSLWGIVAIGVWNGKDKDTFRGFYESVELSCLPEMPTNEIKLATLLAAKDKLEERGFECGINDVQLNLAGLLDEDAIRALYE